MFKEIGDTVRLHTQLNPIKTIVWLCSSNGHCNCLSIHGGEKIESPADLFTSPAKTNSGVVFRWQQPSPSGPRKRSWACAELTPIQCRVHAGRMQTKNDLSLRSNPIFACPFMCWFLWKVFRIKVFTWILKVLLRSHLFIYQIMTSPYKHTNQSN